MSAWYMCRYCGNISAEDKCEICGKVNNEQQRILNQNIETGDYDIGKYNQEED